MLTTAYSPVIACSTLSTLERCQRPQSVVLAVRLLVLDASNTSIAGTVLWNVLQTHTGLRNTCSCKSGSSRSTYAWTKSVVVLVQCNENVCWSVHRGRARACARARVCACAAQVLPNAPTPAGNGSPVPELPNHRTLPRAQGPPPCRALVHGNFFPMREWYMYAAHRMRRMRAWGRS